MVPAVLVPIAKVLGKEVAIAAMKKYLVPKVTDVVVKKVGAKATDAGLSHIVNNQEALRTAGMALGDKRARADALVTISQIGLGAVGAALATRVPSARETPSKDILADEKEAVTERAKGTGDKGDKVSEQGIETTPAQTSASFKREENRKKDEYAQSVALRSIYGKR